MANCACERRGFGAAVAQNLLGGLGFGKQGEKAGAVPPPPPGTPPGGSQANPFVLTGQTQPASLTLKPFGTPPKSPVNLLGEVEKWGINPATTVSNVNLNVSQMTGAQLNELLKKLPDGVTYSLNLEKENQ